uniref:GYF domain-containing protein n=1 Tax=Kalanchoe fedtschenkoi TaxID=63787 RepID=A0A7N0VCS7_KALFE
MADRNASDSRHGLSLAAPPPISKDNQGSESSIPLSPQWLLPKMGESKHETGNEDDHSSNNSRHLDIPKSPRSTDEVVDLPKKKDVFRPSLLDQETSRRDRWRDEERDTNPSVRRDRWREGDKEPTEIRKTDRWTDSSASKSYGETRRAAADRWGDSSSRDTGYERRESKWTSRWGPNDKDKELLPEKSQEFARESDIMYDKGLPNSGTHRKDDKEGDVYRPWRSNSSQSRGRGESPHSLNLTSSKGTSFSYGRGRSENQPPAFGHAHGRPNMSTSGNSFGTHSQSSGLVSDKVESIHFESTCLRYSRAKLLDVYKTMDKRSSWKLLDSFVEVPSLTQEELSEPLGLSTPSPEEAVILMGIDKGDILSSGVPAINKEGPAGRHPSEFSQSGRPKFGSKEDISHAIDGSIDDDVEDLKSGYSNYPEGAMYDKQTQHFASHHTYHDTKPRPEDSTPHHKPGEISASRDIGIQRNIYVPPGSSWRSPSLAEHARPPSLEGREVSADRQSQYVRSQHHENGSAYMMYQNNDQKWQVGGRPVNETQSSVFLDREHESRKLPPPSPEDLILLYKDPQGNIQGPFTGSDIIGWYDAGFFGIDLQVRLASASKDQPFSLLGDVMPHLRSKAGPPPGFNAPRQSDPVDLPSRLSYSNSGKLLVNSSETNPLKNNLRPMHGFSTEADNRFLESLMTGPQGYFGNNSTGVTPIGVDHDNLFLLAKKMAVEQQSSWTVREPAPMVQPEIGSESASVHPKLQSPVIDNIRPNLLSQSSELLAMLQGVSERSSSGFNNAAGNWSNFPVHGSSFKDNLDVYHGQNIQPPSAFGIQQQILQAQNNPSLINLLSQSNPSGVLKPDNISSGMPQDPLTLNMLQQQYLLQLHSQTPASMQQLSVLDKLLLLQQQQKQEQLIRQQHMLAQTLSESLTHQHLGVPSYGHIQANAIPGGDIDQLQHRMAQEHLNSGMQRSAPIVHDESGSNMAKLNPQVPQEVSKLSSQISQEVSELNAQVQQEVADPLSELKRRGASMMAEIADGSASSDNSFLLQEADHILEDFEPFNAASTAELSKNSGAPPESVEAFGLVSAALHDNDSLKNSSYSSGKLSDVYEERIIERDQVIEEPAKVKEVKNIGTLEVKKGSDKKARKQKTSKSSEQGKGVSKMTMPPTKLFEVEGTNVNDSGGVDLLQAGDWVPYSQNQPEIAMPSDKISQQTLPGQDNLFKVSEGYTMMNVEQKAAGLPSHNTQLHPGQRAWKPAPGFKPKSLLEIQQEEQIRAQAEVQNNALSSSANTTSLPTPWAGVVANADTKTSKVIYMDVGSTETNSEISLKTKSGKSQLHDLLAEEANTKSNDVEMKHDNQKFTLTEPLISTNSESIDDFDFIQAKDTKKNRKKSGKAKGASSKAVSVSPDVSLGSSPIEKIKTSRQVQQEKEILPAVPSGPSLGDFVVWKGESASFSPSPAPAWSTDSGKVQPVLLRDILKEQEKKTALVPHLMPPATPPKPQLIQPAHGSGPARSLGGSSLPKTPASVPVTSISGHSKQSGDDDLFWGPIDSTKQESKQTDFPQLATHSSRGVKSSTQLKGSIGGLTKQKSVAGRTADNSHSSSPQSSLKGRKDVMSKQAEAMDFRDWCEAESIRLIGSKDTSFLEFCLKQTRSEAEILLVENLGSYDPDHEFIDKFLNFKELLPADVIDIAFQSQNDRKSSGGQTSFGIAAVVRESNTQESSTKGGGKKKNKKGKKVSPSVLGFNVVSNRIMMGEIQTVDD